MKTARFAVLMLMVHPLAVAAASLVVWSPACGGKTVIIDPVENFNAWVAQTILIATDTREVALQSAGRAYRDGLIDEDARQRIIEVGDRVGSVLQTTKDTAAAFLRAGGSRQPVLAAIAALNVALSDLLVSVQASGVLTERPL